MTKYEAIKIDLDFVKMNHVCIIMHKNQNQNHPNKRIVDNNQYTGKFTIEFMSLEIY